MHRQSILESIGSKFLTTNVENDGVSYHCAYNDARVTFKGIEREGTLAKGQSKLLDIRCQDNKFGPDWSVMNSLPLSDKLINVFTSL